MARAVVIAVIVEVDAVAAAAVANRDTEQYHRVSREKEEILYLLRKRGQYTDGYRGVKGGNTETPDRFRFRKRMPDSLEKSK